MINGIQGKPGGGKSYEAVVTHIIPTITKDKRKVVTNLPLNIDHFCAVHGEYCRELIEVIDGQFHNYGGERPFSKKDHFLQYEEWQNEKGLKTYFFIDECHLAMPSSGTEKELCEFFSMHRHYGFDIMLITQNFRKVNRDIKDMVQNGYRCIKKTALGQDSKYVLKVHDGAAQSNQSVVATHEREYEKRYFPYYQSHTKSNVSVEESATKDIQVWWKHWTIKLSLVFLAVFLMIVAKIIRDHNAKNSPAVESEIENVIEKPVSTVPVNKIGIAPKAAAAVPASPVPDEFDELTKKEMEIEQRKLNERKRKVALNSHHPYYKVELHIAGWARYTERYGKDFKLKKDYHISASQNGQHIFELGLDDLILAGYRVSVKSTCMIELWYDDYHDFLTCNSPSVGPKITGGNMVASN